MGKIQSLVVGSGIAALLLTAQTSWSASGQDEADKSEAKSVEEATDAVEMPIEFVATAGDAGTGHVTATVPDTLLTIDTTAASSTISITGYCTADLAGKSSSAKMNLRAHMACGDADSTVKLTTKAANGVVVALGSDLAASNCGKFQIGVGTLGTKCTQDSSSYTFTPGGTYHLVVSTTGFGTGTKCIVTKHVADQVFAKTGPGDYQEFHVDTSANKSSSVQISAVCVDKNKFAGDSVPITVGSPCAHSTPPSTLKTSATSAPAKMSNPPWVFWVKMASYRICGPDALGVSIRAGVSTKNACTQTQGGKDTKVFDHMGIPQAYKIKAISGSFSDTCVVPATGSKEAVIAR